MSDEIDSIVESTNPGYNISSILLVSRPSSAGDPLEEVPLDGARACIECRGGNAGSSGFRGSKTESDASRDCSDFCVVVA